MSLATAPFLTARPASVTQQFRHARYGHPPVLATAVAEQSRTPGLVVAPRMQQDITGAWSFSGAWCVLHQPSGLVVGHARNAGLGHARDLAHLLGELPIDWTQPDSTLRDRAVWSAAQEPIERTLLAINQARPARLLNSSWREIPPPYWVGQEPGMTDFVFRTWSEAAEFALTEGHLPDWEGAVIGREPAPMWDLICAALDCQTQPLDGDVGWMFHRRELGEAARDEGWRRLDEQRWLCERCSALFIPTCP